MKIDPRESAGSVAIALALVASLGPLLPAQLVWQQRTTATSPSARSGHALAYDSVRGTTVLFGGWDTSALGDTWEYGTAWTQRTPAASPSARVGHALAYDSARDTTVLFGGTSGSPLYVYFADTWVWNGMSWTQRTSAPSPSARAGHALAYDSVRGVTVLFGGSDAAANRLSDTWEWNGTTWTRRASATSPPARAGHALAYDRARGVTVLFGGESGHPLSPLSDTWEWNGTTWTPRPTAPPARYGHALAYDSARGVTVLFGGGSPGLLSDTWEWDGTTWTQQTPATNPRDRSYHALAYDSARGRTVLVAGRGELNSDLSDTWEYALPLAPRGEWIVDINNRPGTDFTDLQLAFDIVPETDRIHIRDGTYPAVTLQRPLVVNADPAFAFQFSFPPLSYDLTVQGIPRGRRAVLSGFNLPTDFFTGLGSRLAIVDCVGNVHLEAMTCRAGISVLRSTVVTMTEVNTRLSAVDASIMASECELRGGDSLSIFGGQRPATVAVAVTRSSLGFSRCNIRGGGVAAGSLPGESAMVLDASFVGLTGVSGNYLSTGWSGLPAVRGSGGALVIDPVIAVTGSIDPTIPVTRRTVPSLDMGALMHGTSSPCALRGDPGHAFGVLLSVPIEPVFVAFLNGGLAIELTLGVQVAAGVLDGAGLASWSLPVPGDPALAGVVVAMQGVTASASGATLTSPITRRIL
ncbi:MAG: kelch repeat-containing protein [Planctomycetota bacterium]